MKTFRSLYEQKLSDPDFKRLFDEECHVCNNTMAIFQTALETGITLAQLATDLAVDVEKLHLLAASDYCDPPLTFRLCRHLGLPVPEHCPRMGKECQ